MRQATRVPRAGAVPPRGRSAQWARSVLLASEGVPNRAIANAVGTSRLTMLLWRARFAAASVPGPRCKAGARNTQWSAGRPRSTLADPRFPVSAARGRDDPAELLPREGNAGGKARPYAGQVPQLLRREGLPKTLVDLRPRDPPCAPASLAIPQQAKLSFEALDGFARLRQFAPQQEDPLLPKPCLASLEAFDFSVHQRPSWPLPHHP